MINRQQIITVCQREVGTVENPPKSNNTKYGSWYGLNGVAWCGIFVSWVFNEAGNTLPEIDKGHKGFHYVPTLYNRAIQKKWTTNKPQKGDIVLFDFKADGKNFAQHVGIFQGWNADGSFNSYEGNTSSGEKGSQDNGGCVAFRRRDKKLALVFINSDLIK